MPAAIPNGGGGSDVTTAELAAYHSASAKPSGDLTAQEQAVVQSVEERIEEVAQGWVDSGGSGGHQADVALEVAAFVGDLEGRRLAAVNQWSKEAARGSRKAQAEMHGADTASLAEIARLLYELRERLNDSPYAVLLAGVLATLYAQSPWG